MATVVEEHTIPIMETLVKYDNPVLITIRHDKEVSENRQETKEEISLNVRFENLVSERKSPSVDIRKEPVEVLNRILPPKSWEEEGQKWIQKVSSTPATRLDVINLQEQLNMKLQLRQARETGICPVRRELFDQCFDELIRQITINCAERGLLLLRVRDEMKLTMGAYQTLYQSSIAFGLRKAIQAEQGKEDLINAADELVSQNTNLEKTVAELRHNLEQAEKRAAELREAEEKKYTEEIIFLKKTNQQLKMQLEGIIAPKK